MTNEQAIKRLKHLTFEPTVDEWDEEALQMAIEALNFMDEYHQSNIEAYAHDMGVSLEQAERELRIEPKTSDSGSVDSEMPEVKTDRTTSGDLISRQDAIDATWFEPSYTDPLNVLTEVRDRLKVLPSAQPERKKGKWIYTWYGKEYRCSICGGIMIGTPKYCSDCGAEMEV